MYSENALNVKRHKTKGRLLQTQVKSKNIFSIIITIIFLLLIILLYIIDIPRTISLSGRVEKEIETIESNYTGYIEKLFISLNQEVSPGADILIIKKHTNSSSSNNLNEIENYYKSLSNKTQVEYLSNLSNSKRKILELQERIDTLKNINLINNKDISILNEILKKKKKWLLTLSSANISSKQTVFKLETEILGHKLVIENLLKEITNNNLNKLIYSYNIDEERGLEVLLDTNENYNRRNIEYEKKRSIDDKFVILKSSLHGRIVFFPVNLNQKISIGDTLVQIEPDNSKLNIVIKSNKPLLTVKETLKKTFTIKYVTNLGYSRSFKANPTSVEKYKFSSELSLNNNQPNNNDKYLIKFNVPDNTTVINNNIINIIHGTKVIAFIKQDEKSLSTIIFNDITQQLDNLLSYVF